MSLLNSGPVICQLAWLLLHFDIVYVNLTLNKEMHPHKILKCHLVLLQDCQARLIFAFIAVNLRVWLSDSAHGAADTHLLRRQTCCRKK